MMDELNHGWGMGFGWGKKISPIAVIVSMK